MTKRWQRVLILVMTAALVLFAAVTVALDRRQVVDALAGASWLYLVPAVLLMAVSYFFLSFGFAAVYLLFSVNVSRRHLMEVGFVSIVLGHMISFGGLSGLAVRLSALEKHELKTEEIVAPSLFHSYFNNLALLLLLPLGLASVLATRSLSHGQTIGLWIATAALAIAFILVTAIAFSRAAREVLERALSRLIRLVTRRDVGPWLAALNDAFTRGMAAVRRRPRLLLVPLAAIVIDWASSMAALSFCFSAVGSPVGLEALVTGYSLGVTVGLLSMVPGGLGVQEGSMAAVYAWLGVPFEQAVMAAVLFRLVYYFVPFAASLVLYRRLLLPSSRKETPTQ